MASEDDIWEEPTTTFVKRAAVGACSEQLEGIDTWASEEVTRAGWQPPTPDFGDDGAATAAGFVCTPQPWPTVLDQHSLTFVGAQSDLLDEFPQLTEEVSVLSGGAIFTQGHSSELLYLLDSGTVRLHRERDGRQDLGEVAAGCFFGELGALMGLPATASAVADGPCTLRVVTFAALAEEVRRRREAGSDEPVPSLVPTLRLLYLDVVAQRSPLFRDLEAFEQLHEHGSWVSIPAGEPIGRLGQASPFYLIVTGYAKITRPAPPGQPPHVLGYLCPGDIAGEIDPAPVDIVAETTVAALRFQRLKVMTEFPDEALEALEARIKRCRKVLATLDPIFDGTL